MNPSRREVDILFLKEGLYLLCEGVVEVLTLAWVIFAVLDSPVGHLLPSLTVVGAALVLLTLIQPRAKRVKAIREEKIDRRDA